ncbi:arylesterase [Noviherbaspirillum sp. 17J57-3]|uniref:Arylesterase n=2 Tax=Noviherbaspirillum galbum TaxID=2709383 RepID=A0A6B3SQ17_9BURK|nr:arylesterase [Noviherbaspirillum galbum]
MELNRQTRWLMRVAMAMVLSFCAACAYSASKTVLVLGDSLSAEYGLARGSGWVALLGQKLETEKRDVNLVNASVSGETTSGGRTRLPALLDQHKPDIVVIELGGNDGLRGLPVQAAESNLKAMITAAQAAKAKVLLVGMQIPPNYGREYTQKFSGMYQVLARSERVALVPFLLKGVAEQSRLFQPDRIHPVAEAQPVILDNVWPELKVLLGLK